MQPFHLTARVAIGAVAIACGSVCGLTSAILNFEMVDKVNEKLPAAEQFGHLGWYIDKSLRLKREYKRLYPNGPLLLRTRILMALMLASLVVAAWGFGFFTKG